MRVLRPDGFSVYGIGVGRVMIEASLTQLAFQLNQYFRGLFDLDEDIVVVSNILEQDGSISPQVNNKLALFLVNIEKDSMPYPARQSGAAGGGVVAVSTLPVYLNLYVMVAGHFNKYTEALKFISSAISFFQRRPLFNHQNTPELDKRIEKLVLDIENLDMRDLSTLWGVLSGKYLPSILYKVRMVAFDAAEITGQVKTFKAPQTNAQQ